MTDLGKQLRTLGDENTEERQHFVEETRQIHANFWQKWQAFRCTQEGDGHGHAFWHIVDLIDRDKDPDGMPGLFADFMQLQPNTLVVDIAAGIRPAMLDVLLRHTSDINGYVVLEPAINESQVRENFQKAGHSQLIEFAPWDFWKSFPAEEIIAIARRRKADHIVTMTYWGATYLPGREIRNWLSGALSISERVFINMLSQGRFDPQVLKRRYTPLLLRLVLTRRATLKEAIRALKGIPTMVRFGTEFSKLMPLWTASEIKDLVADIAENGHIQDDVLMNQTTFLELRPPETSIAQ